jgi:Rad3-related DNA helicase
MEFDLDQRTARLSVGEFASFITGPRDAGGGSSGLWRAQLGTHWHNELRARASEEMPATEFEIPITGSIFHRGWTLTLSGRIDQLVRTSGVKPDLQLVLLREIKSVTRPLPTDEAELRNAYPDYFAQIGAYAALWRINTASTNTRVAAELCFVEVSSGLAQTVPVSPADETVFRVQLERVVEFLDLRLRARERLKNLRFRPAFAAPRPGQESTRADLTALFERQPLVFFEAPTGFGKTGVLLEFALGQLKSGHFDRALYLTSKSTGQIQVVRTLSGMTAETPPGKCHAIRDTSVGAASEAGSKVDVADTIADSPLSTLNSQLPGRSQLQPNSQPASTDQSSATPVAVWHVRNKSEHCINHTFHCVRDQCEFLADAAARWSQSGLARFYLDEKHARDLPTLLAAGRAARICPYEITRSALAFNDVWIGDYNYVFAPRNRGLFFEQPGFNPARTLLLIDEAHNLPSRVADAYSHAFSATEAFAVRDELHRQRPLAQLVTAWEHWCHFLDGLKTSHALSLEAEDEARHLLDTLAKWVPTVPLDLATLSAQAADSLWQIPALLDELTRIDLPRLWWCPRDGELALTCLDAAAAIGTTLREFGGVVLASATLSPVDGFAAACGLAESDPAQNRGGERSSRPAASTQPAPERLGALNKRETKKLYRQLTSAADLLRVEEARDAAQPALLRAHTPWRDGSYDVAFDVRVDTTFQHRSRYYTTTAGTIVALSQATGGPGTGHESEPEARAPNLQSGPAGSGGNVAVFFPSYAYAEAIRDELSSIAPALRVAMQPRVRDLAAQSSWVESSLSSSDALFLVLGSSFAESIDALGGRVDLAMVVGPALPEVNAVQHARLAEATRAGLSRDEAFRRVYQVPGMIKVNQALGRLVRAPGHGARVLLHCRRFAETSYHQLLAPEYQVGATVSTDAALNDWLGRSR